MSRYNPLSIEQKWQKNWKTENHIGTTNILGTLKEIPSETEILSLTSNINLIRETIIQDVLTRFYRQQNLDAPELRNKTTHKESNPKHQTTLTPLEIINDGYGADTLRTYVLFIRPHNHAISLDIHTIGSVYHFLNRCWTLCFDKKEQNSGNSTIRNHTIKKITTDIRKHKFNTAIATLMKYVNELYKKSASHEDLVILAKLLKPFAPHLASEMLEKLDTNDEWPTWDDKYLITDTATVVVQVNGKLRTTLTVNASDLDDKNKILNLALADPKVRKHTTPNVKKTIYIKKAKLLNLVV